MLKNKNYLFVILGIYLVLAFLIFLFYNQIKHLSEGIVFAYGYLGLFLVVMIFDIIISPIPPDVVVFVGVASGLNVWLAILAVSLGSLAGGSIDYFFGHLLGEKGFRKWFKEKHLKAGEEIMKKYGVWAVIIGALTPIPYGIVAWISGIYRFKYWVFALTSLFARFFRFFIVGFLSNTIF